MASLNGSFIIGVSGMVAQSEALGVISDNIANVNTVGYKASTTRFETLLQPHNGPAMFNATKYASNTYNSGGVASRFTQVVDVNGIVQSTTNPTHMAVSGRGFFQVARANTQAQATSLAGGSVPSGVDRLYTRDGNFNMSKDGLFLNTAGDVLMGVAVPAGEDGLNLSAPSSTTALTPVLVRGDGLLAAEATENIVLNINLPANTTAANGAIKVETRSFTADGNEYTMVLNFTRTANAGEWTVTLGDVKPVDSTEAKPTLTATATTINFDVSTGLYSSPSAGFNVGSFTTANGETLSPTINLTDLTGGLGTSTMFGDYSFNNGSSQDGHTNLYRERFEISDSGLLSEIYPDGIKIPRFKIPLVSFVNNNVLEVERGNAYAQTTAAGDPFIGFPADSNNLGKIISSGLENSTTDIAEEFTAMIVTERAYQANSKTITTVDEMTKLLTRLGV